MSTQNRTGGGGRNQKKLNSAGNNDTNAKKTEIKAEKEKSQPKPTAEQIRIAQITDCRTEDPKMREKVATLIEMTQRSEEEVCCALYECDNNLENAVNFLLETLPVGAFEISSKKRKNRTTNATTDGTADGEWTETNNNTDNRERSRNRATTRSGRGGSDSRGWRGREARENERNASDSKGGEGGWRGGRNRGGSRGGYGGRGGKGGRPGPRGMGSRDSGRNYSRQQQDTQEVDTWDNAIATNAEQMKQPDAFSDAWGDWDNEEYVGSLKDTKVFTPSNLQTQSLSVISDLSTPPGLEQHMVNQSHITADDLVQQYSTSYSTTVVSSTTTAAAAAANSVQFADIHSANASQHLRLGLDAQQMNSSSTLSAEQSQYFNSLQSQGSNQQTNVNSYQNSSVQYQTPYVSNNVFGDQNVTSQPSVRRARAKVPPPSKIPASAVEMPGDTLNNIYLDVQFGGLDFAAEESFDALSEKFNATTIDGQQNVQSQEVSTDFQPKSSQQTSLPTALQTSQMIPNSDTLSSSQTDPLSSNYSQRTSGNVSQQVTGVSSTINASGNNTLDQLSKSDPYNQSNASNTTGYQNSYNSSSSTNKSTSYQSSGSTQGYNSANYTTNTQVKVSSGNNYQPSSNSAYNTYNQNSVNSYQQQNNASSNNSSNSTSGSSANSSNAAQNIPVGGSTSAVNNTGSSSNTGYLSNQYQSNQTSSAFPSQQSGYQNSQSVYGTTGLTNNTGFSGSTNTSSSQYSNFSSTKLKETSASASTHFDSVSNVTSSSTASSSVSSVSSSSVTTNSMSSPSLGLANTKVTNSTAKNTAGILPNIQMVSQFIQPYYQQPALYSYEDIQMMQQRMPHVTQYYDINYPPTSLGAAGVRDANLGSVAYSAMDGRFARTDNNSSPVSNVSSTMSQQAGSSGPMLNVPYAYFYGGNMMPGGFQYGTPAIYPQQMPAANATSGGQFAKPSYNSGYGSTSYDALSQATQDYSKGAYAGSSVSQQSKTQAVTNPPQAASASDITSSMYGKSHVALNKVNSYEKQSFHSGTPPPFNLTGTQTAAATSAQPYGMYIQPMPATHHNMNIHPTMHQMNGRIQNNTTRRDSSSTGQRQQPSSQNKSGTKQGYSPSTYWTAQN